MPTKNEVHWCPLAVEQHPLPPSYNQMSLAFMTPTLDYIGIVAIIITFQPQGRAGSRGPEQCITSDPSQLHLCITNNPKKLHLCITNNPKQLHLSITHDSKSSTCAWRRGTGPSHGGPARFWGGASRWRGCVWPGTAAAPPQIPHTALAPAKHHSSMSNIPQKPGM